MTLIETRYEHITLDEAGVAWIEATRMKIIQLVQAHKAYGWSPEELYFQYPYLSLGQIYSALAYYWDHKDELDADILRRYDRVEQIRLQTVQPAFLTANLYQKRQ